MKNKILTFIVASVIYALLYFAILNVVENDYDNQSKLIQCLFFGLSMGLTEVSIRPAIINKIKNKK